MALLEIRHLVKHFPKAKAVNGISLKIDEGVCFGLLGPNGAGKTTTIELIEGIKEPTSGHILYRGEPLGAAFREETGIQFQTTSLQDYLKVSEVLRLFAGFYKKAADVNDLKKLCSLEEFWNQDASELSGGQRQRMLLAVSLVNDPKIIFLDEPTTGLDPQARRNFWDLVKLIKSQGKTIVLTTHYMEEAYVLCDEIAIMDRGLVIAKGNPDVLLKEHFDMQSIQIPKEDLERSQVGSAFHTSAVPGAGGFLEIKTAHVNETLKKLISSGVDLSRMRLHAQTLEDLFLKLTGKAIDS